MSRIVQLEIRGVGGATAEEILDGPVTQTGGDRIAGFYRPNEPPIHGREVDAYDWGRLTSGAWTTALWWILLPFTLINVAGWMFQPSDAEHSRPDEPVWSSLWFGRLLMIMGGLAMTAVYVLWLVTLTTEIVAFGCASDQACADRWYMAPVSWFGAHRVWLVTLGVGLAAVLILLLFLYIGRTQDRLEGYETDMQRRQVGIADHRRKGTSRVRRNTPLQNQGFWYKWEEHRRLFRWHLGLAMLLLGLAAGHAMRRVGWESPPGNAWIAIAVVVVILVATVWMLSGPEKFREPAQDDPGSSNATGKQVGWTSAHLGSAAGGYVFAWAATGWIADSFDRTFGFLNSIRLLSVVLYVAAVLTLVLLLYRQSRKDRYPSTGALWLMPGVAAGLAITVAGAGFVAIAHLLGRGLLGAQWVRANGFDIVIVDILAVSLIVAGVYAGITYKRTAKPVEEVRKDYFPNKNTGELTDRERSWVGDVARSRVIARLPSGGDWTLTVLIVALLVLAGLQFLIGGFDWRAGPDGAFAAPLFGIEGLNFFHAFAATVIVLYVFPGVQLIRANTRSRANRRQLGKVWDVLSFWQRRFHPLAAPCYAERAVPEFRNRIRHHLLRDKKVIVSAHSQGAVIAFAALLQIAAETEALGVEIDGVDYESFRDMMLKQQSALDHDPLRRVGLVTFGAPLSSLYGRFFAWHFGTSGRFQALRNELATLASSGKQAWRSLYRPTDYIGREVFIEPGGVLDPSDSDADIRVKEALGPLFFIESHSNYEREDQLRDTVELFAREIL